MTNSLRRWLVSPVFDRDGTDPPQSHPNPSPAGQDERSSVENSSAEEQPRMSEERFRTMFAEHAAVMLLIDPDTGAILNANYAASVFYGYAIETLCTMNIDAINVMSHAEIAEILRQVQTGQQKVFVFLHRRADGQVRTVEVHSSPIRLDHKPVLFSIIHDITERKRAEEDLRASEVKYRVIADNTFDWEFWQAPDGTFLYSSPSCARVTGHTADEFLRNPHLLFEIIHPDDVAAFKRHKTHVSIRQVPETIRFRVVTPDASVRWIEHACQPVFDDRGQYRGTRGSNRDITEHQQLSSRVEDLAALVELADVAIIACTFDDVITYWNRGAEVLYGWHRQTALGQNIHTLLHTVFPRSPQAVRQALLDEDYWSGELTHTRANQQRVIVSSRQTLRYTPDGKPLSILQINVDITARKQAEGALHDSQARANALLAAVPDMMFRMNRAGIFLDYKAERRDLYAQTERTLVGKSIREVSPPEFAELIENEIRATLGVSKVRTFEYQLPIPERGVRHYEARIVASGADEVTAIVRDITERKQTEAQLQANQEKYYRVLENIREGFVMMKNLTDENDRVVDFRCVDANAATKLQTGYDPQFMIGKTLRELDPQLDPHVLEECCRVAMTGESATLDYYSVSMARDFRIHVFCPQSGFVGITFQNITVPERAPRVS